LDLSEVRPTSRPSIRDVQWRGTALLLCICVHCMCETLLVLHAVSMASRLTVYVNSV